MKKGESLYGVEIQILDDVRFWGSIILSGDFSVEHITRRVASVFKSKGFVMGTLSSDRDSANNMASVNAMFFTGKVQRVADGKYDMYEMILTGQVLYLVEIIEAGVFNQQQVGLASLYLSSSPCAVRA